MAASVSFSSSRKDSLRSLEAGSAEASRSQVIQSLVEDLFGMLAKKLTHIGVSLSQAHDVAHLMSLEKKKEEQTSYPSLFDDPLCPRLTQSEKARMVEIIHEHPCNKDAFFIHIMGMRMMNNWRSMEKELGLQHGLNKQQFFVDYWRALTFLSLKTEVDSWMSCPKTQDIRHIKLLKHPTFLSPKEYQEKLIEFLSSLCLIKKPSLAKERMFHDISLFLKFLDNNICAHKLCYLTRMDSYQECQQKVDHITDYLPLIQYVNQLSRILRKVDLISKESDRLFEKVFTELEREIQAIKGARSKTLRDKSLEKMYALYIESSIHPSRDLAEINKRICVYLQKKLDFPFCYVSKKITDLYSITIHFYWMQKIAASLELDHGFPFTPLLNRVRSFLLLIGSSKREDSGKDYPTALSLFSPVLDKCKDLHFLRMDRGTIRAMNQDFLSIMDVDVPIERLDEMMNQEGEVAESEPLPSETLDAHQRKGVIFTRVPQYIELLSHVHDHFNESDFESKLRGIYEETLAIFNLFFKDSKSDEVQEQLRECFLELLMPICYECLIYSDLKQLLFQKSESIEKAFPEALLDLVCFELPKESLKTKAPAKTEDVGLLETHFKSLTITSSEQPSARKEAVSSQSLVKPLSKIAKISKMTLTHSEETEDQPPERSESPIEKEFEGIRKFRQIVSLLKRMNLKVIRQKGSHVIFEGPKGIVVVPNHEEIKEGTKKSIIKQVISASEG